jgi:hypothetical protein
MRRRIRQFAALVLFIICSSNFARVRAQSALDPHWLLEYRGKYKVARRDLKWDRRFKPFINHYLTMKQKIVPNNASIGDVASLYLGLADEYRSEDESYFYADGCVPHACPAKGLLWVDLRASPPTVVLAAIDDPSGSAAPGTTLYLFTNRELSPRNLPGTLKSSISYWTSKPLADKTYQTFGTISKAVIIGPDGRERSIDPITLGVPPGATQKAEN